MVHFMCRGSQVVFTLYVLSLRQGTSRNLGLGLPGPKERSMSLCSSCTSNVGSCPVSGFCTSCSKLQAMSSFKLLYLLLTRAGQADAATGHLPDVHRRQRRRISYQQVPDNLL